MSDRGHGETACYQHGLIENGISYDRQDVQLDYRIDIIVELLIPIMELSWGNPPLTWIPKLEKALWAVDELNCRDLIAGV
jgi:hypothetical protein